MKIFLQYKDGFHFVTGKNSEDFKDVHATIPINAPCLTRNTKAGFNYVLVLESQV